MSSGRFIYEIRFDESRAPVVAKWAELQSPNGRKILADGTHLVCESQSAAVVMLDAAGKLTRRVATHCEGQPLRRPNDLCLDMHRGFYFTDPGGARPGERNGTVHYTDAQEVTHLVARLSKPNGIALRSDGKNLLVADSLDNCVYQYQVREPGRVGRRDLLAQLPSKGVNQIDNQLDGLCLDRAGNLFVAHYGMRRVQVIDSKGKVVRRYAGGNLMTSNVAFHGPQMDRLLVTGCVGHEARKAACTN